MRGFWTISRGNRDIALALALLALQVGALFVLGQPWMSASGQLMLWANNPLSPETSQQIADWYSLSHIVHGFLFYGLLKLACPRLPFGVRLLLAMGFLFASRAPAWVTMAAGIALEALAAVAIRDGLILNILNFIHPIPFIERWQAGFALTATFLPLPERQRRPTKKP